MMFWKRKRQPKHRHVYVLVGDAGAGWHLYLCECGAEKIG